MLEDAIIVLSVTSLGRNDSEEDDVMSIAMNEGDEDDVANLAMDGSFNGDEMSA